MVVLLLLPLHLSAYNTEAFNRSMLFEPTPKRLSGENDLYVFYPDYNLFGDFMGRGRTFFNMSWNKSWQANVFDVMDIDYFMLDETKSTKALIPSGIGKHFIFDAAKNNYKTQFRAGVGIDLLSTPFGINLPNAYGFKYSFSKARTFDVSLYLSTRFHLRGEKVGTYDPDDPDTTSYKALDEKDLLGSYFRFESEVPFSKTVEHVGVTWASFSEINGWAGVEYKTVVERLSNTTFGSYITNDNRLWGADIDLDIAGYKIHHEGYGYRNSYGIVTTNQSGVLDLTKKLKYGTVQFLSAKTIDYIIGPLRMNFSGNGWYLHSNYTPAFAHIDDDNLNFVAEGANLNSSYATTENNQLLEPNNFVYGKDLNTRYNNIPDWDEDFALWSTDKYFAAPLLFDDFNNNLIPDNLEDNALLDWPMFLRAGERGGGIIGEIDILSKVTFIPWYKRNIKLNTVNDNKQISQDGGLLITSKQSLVNLLLFSQEISFGFIDDNIADNFNLQSDYSEVEDSLFLQDKFVIKANLASQVRFKKIFENHIKLRYNYYRDINSSEYLLQTHAIWKGKVDLIIKKRVLKVVPEFKLEASDYILPLSMNEDNLSDHLQAAISSERTIHAIVKGVFTMPLNKQEILFGAHFRDKLNFKNHDLNQKRLTLATEYVIEGQKNEAYFKKGGKLNARFGFKQIFDWVEYTKEPTKDFQIYANIFSTSREDEFNIKE